MSSRLQFYQSSTTTLQPTQVYPFRHISNVHLMNMSHLRQEETIHAPGTLFSPESHDKLPAELWSEIFLCCLEGAYVKPLSRVDQPDAREGQLPWALGRVCSGWRRIALSEPRLWNRVQVPHTPLILEGSSSTADYYLNMARSLFCLSKGTLISFSTTLFPTTIDSGTDTDNPLPRLIVPYANQFCEMTIQSPSSWIYSILELPSGSFLNVEALTLQFCGPTTIRTFTIPPSYEAFGSSGRLRRVRFAATGGFAYCVDPSLISMPWEQLQHLIFENVCMPPEAAVTLLKRCNNIVECALCFNYTSPTSFTATTTLVLQHLQSLRLVSDYQMDRFLALLTLPALCTLKLKTFKRWLRWSKGTILQLIQRSGCRIKFLHSTVMIHADDMAPLLMASPTLVELTIPSSLIPDSTVEAIVRGDLTCSLKVINYTVDSMDVFLDLVEARSLHFADNSKGRGIHTAIGHFSGTSSDIESLPWGRYDELRERLLKDCRNILFKMS